MSKILSPWISQIKKHKKVTSLSSSKSTDIMIVGGGIAGVVTAYFILQYTDKKVILLEADRIAHGATGHNGGYLATYFERPFYELADQFGLKIAEEGRLEVENSWQLLAEIRTNCKLTTPLWEVTGWAGSRNIEELLIRLKNRYYREKAGHPQDKILISDRAEYIHKIPKKYRKLYSLVPQKDILSLLETDNMEFTAALPAKKGCMNSAMFTQELFQYIEKHYKTRFQGFEKSPVKRVVLKDGYGLATVGNKNVSAKKIILCTNGFENFTLINKHGKDIDTKFHHSVRGSVGYMAAFLEERNKPPVAISYLPQKFVSGVEVYDSEPYFYLSRRPYETDGSGKYNLICLGGPELLLPDSNLYIKSQHSYPDEALQSFDNFLRTTYKHVPKRRVDFKYKWHGLMGYTPNGVRMVGFEPLNKVLMYNLGCNGLGLLPSISGGKRIARLVKGEKLKRSIFDPLTKA